MRASRDVFLGMKEISCSQQFKIIFRKTTYERKISSVIALFLIFRGQFAHCSLPSWPLAPAEFLKLSNGYIETLLCCF